MSKCRVALDRWRAVLPSLGRRRVAAFAECRDCAAQPDQEPGVVRLSIRTGRGEHFTVDIPCAEAASGTWSWFGRIALCHLHATMRARRD
jgi:hypothetical protein